MNSITGEVLHLRNHLQSIRDQLDPVSLQLIPLLLRLIRAQNIVSQLDKIAYTLAITPHQFAPRYEIWQYNAQAIQAWFRGALYEDLPQFDADMGPVVRDFLLGDVHRRAFIQGKLEDKTNVGYIPTDLVDGAMYATIPNYTLSFLFTGLLRPSAVFVKVLSMLQDIALRSAITMDEVWILQEEELETEGMTFRKCFVFLALACARRSLLNSSIVDIDPRIKLASSRKFSFQP